MRYLLPLAAAAALVITAYANQQRVKISPGFFTGKDYLEMTATEQRAYITGQINGMLVAPFFGAPDEGLAWLKTCSAKMSDEQLAAIVNRYIHDQPDQMQSNLNVVTFTALRDTCRKLPN